MITCHSVFNVRPKTTLLLPLCPRDARRLHSPGSRGQGSNSRAVEEAGAHLGGTADAEVPRRRPGAGLCGECGVWGRAEIETAVPAGDVWGLDGALKSFLNTTFYMTADGWILFFRFRIQNHFNLNNILSSWGVADLFDPL